MCIRDSLNTSQCTEHTLHIKRTKWLPTEKNKMKKWITNGTLILTAYNAKTFVGLFINSANRNLVKKMFSDKIFVK